MSDELAVVENFFDTLRRGDLSAVVELVADDVDWQSPVTRTHPPEIPWSSIRRSKDEVAAFFKQLGETVKPDSFKVLHTTGQEDRVVVEGKNRGVVRTTGRTYEHDWVMLFTVRGNKIARFRHYYDTADLVGVLRGD
jgi:hypothetical protein